jgi:hypothetical protein
LVGDRRGIGSIRIKPGKGRAGDRAHNKAVRPAILATNNYKNWAPVPGKTADFYEGQNPHGDFLKMYVNRAALANTNAPPSGSIIVEENYDVDKKLMSITVMYRSQGFNTAAGDWYWAKYDPDSSTATYDHEGRSFKVRGKAKSCIECQPAPTGMITYFSTIK